MFFKTGSDEPKEVEFVRVDGDHDEGPSHCEVKYWWTAHHLRAQTVATMDTTRNSGASYKNRVELQNGCLALGHANLFIPSTLNGSCLRDDGKVNETKLKENLSSAIDHLAYCYGWIFSKTMALLLSVLWNFSVRCREITLEINRIQSANS